jgi:hypothetical protein
VSFAKVARQTLECQVDEWKSFFGRKIQPLCVKARVASWRNEN